MSVFTVRRSGQGAQAILTAPLNDIWYPQYTFNNPQNVVTYQSQSFPFGIDLVDGAVYAGTLSADDFGQYGVPELEKPFTSFRPRAGGVFGFEWWLLAPAGSQSGGQPPDSTFYYNIGIRDPAEVRYVAGVPVGDYATPASIAGSRVLTPENGYSNNNTTVIDYGGVARCSCVIRVDSGQEVYFDGIYSGAFRIITDPTVVVDPTLVFVAPPVMKGYFNLVITKLAD